MSVGRRALSLSPAFVVGLLCGCPQPDAGGAPQPSAKPVSDPTASSPQPTGTPAPTADGRAALERNQCTRCHAIDDLPKAARPLDCSGCHSFLDGLTPDDRRYKKIAKHIGEDLLKRYQHNIEHLKKSTVPDLTRIAARVEPMWIDAYLQAPFDLRPTLEESMIRPSLDDEERKAIVRYFAGTAGLPDPYSAGSSEGQAKAKAKESPPAAKEIAKGKTLFKAKGCAVCHTFGNVDFGVSRETLEAGRAANALAPNLRFVKDRTRPEVLVEWILAPSKLKPGTTMPAMGLTRPEAQAVATFLRFGDPQLKPTPKVEKPKPSVLGRKVSYAEMKERTLGKVCVHCHMNDYEKDPGPGNLGGLGYEGIQLSMRTYETLVQGAFETGKRFSVLEPEVKHQTQGGVEDRAGQVSEIVELCLQRYVEHARDKVPAFEDHPRPPYPEGEPGMPLGLPALTMEEINVLHTWIEQGCVGPTEVTGKAGEFDGFLVRDGPIAKNAGCEQREPSAKRPAWAVDAEKVGVVAQASAP